MKYNILFIICFLLSFASLAQGKRIQIIHSDNSSIDEARLPGATILLGNIVIRHEGIKLNCKKAVHYKNENFIKAYGDVVLNQGDSIIQTSQYTEYNGNTQKALSWGNVVIRDSKMTMSTDTLNFDRTSQLLFYKYGATIKDSINVLTSNTGNYYLDNNKFQAISNVVLTNPDYVLESNHLDYYTDSGRAYLYGSSTITSDNNLIYCEKGFYDTKQNISHFTRNARIEYDDKEIKADSLFYNRNLGFASATENIVIIDTINNSVLKGGYAEFFEKLDSAFVVERAVAITNTNKDSLFIHGDTILATGKPERRIIRAYHQVKFFKSDLSGKCDSIHSDQGNGLTQMFRSPILWSKKSQITGDTIQLLNNTETNNLDSLKVLRNAFIIDKDSIGFNQIKGRDLYGKFEENDLRFVNIIGNAEVIHFVRDEDQALIGIEKTSCSEIHFSLRDGKIETSKFINLPDGQTYPPSKLPTAARKLRGFLWREAEKPMSKHDIFIKDEK
ncbi:OstA-like protein [Lutimonas zeaxanthinifaciens]|uniref:OstA-like protein n=1 Tax=Lutimonas zeaxanthinifaciens TaxID=3060215 RepID=UPI00265CE713|nr:OstA-like protein [Lutimonas sp. YSD2104]WKK64852.1 OstA-like protein [Lutimonas sp. YSD2104]